MTKSVILPHRANCLFQIFSVSQLPNIPLTPTTLQQFIAVFTCPQSHTVTFSQYTAVLSHSTLYIPLKTAGFLVKLIRFPYAVLRENYEMYISLHCAFHP